MNASSVRRIAVAIALTGAVLVAPARAMADDAAAAAEVLFQDGKRLYDAGDYPKACLKFEESQKLDPGMGTLYRLADCHERIGRTASAWAAFREVAASARGAGQQARAEDAKKRADALEANLARCEIHVAEPDTPGLVVKRGAVLVGRGQWSVALPVDPGEVVVQASAPGRKPVRIAATAAPKATTRIEVPALEAVPAEVAPPKPNPAVDTKTAELAEPQRDGSTQRTLALVAGGAGVVGLAVGSIFGFVSIGHKNDAEADNHCDAANTCDGVGLAARKDAISAGNVSTIAFVAGGVLLAGGAVLWFTAPKASASRASRTARAGLVPYGAGAGLVVEVP